MARRRKLPFYAISAVTGLGVDTLKYAIGERVRDLRKESATVEVKEAERAAG
jgi:GTP-binding protein